MSSNTPKLQEFKAIGMNPHYAVCNIIRQTADCPQILNGERLIKIFRDQFKRMHSRENK